MSNHPLDIRSFRLYLAATFVSYFGNGMHFIALSWLILELTGSSTLVGTILGLSLLPGLFISFPAGVLSDLHDRKWIAVASDFFRCMVVAIVPLVQLLGLGKVSPMMILAAEVLMAMATPFFTVSTAGLVKEIVPSESLLAANRYKEIALQAAGLLGAGTAGYIIAAFGSYGALLLDASTFLVSGTLIAFISRPHAPSVARSNRTSVLQLAQEGLAYASRRPDILYPVLLSVIPYLIVKSLNVVLGDFVKNVLGGSASQFGWIDGAFAVGTICAGLAMGRLAQRFAFQRLFLGLYALLSAALLAFGASSSFLVCLAGYFAIGFSVLSLKTMIGTHIQATTEGAYIGRVQGLTSSLQGLIGPFMLFLSGYAADTLSPRAVLFTLAGLGLISILAAIHAFNVMNSVSIPAQETV